MYNGYVCKKGMIYMKLKKILAFSVAMTASLSAFGCGSSGNSSSEATTTVKKVAVEDTQEIENIPDDAQKEIIWMGTYDLNPRKGQDKTVEMTLFNNKGGTVAITDASGNNIVSAATGASITLTITPDAGYHLGASSVTVSSPVDGTEITLTGTGPWTFKMPAGGIHVNVTFETDDIVTVSFKAATASGATDAQAKISIAEGNQTITSDGSMSTWQFKVGTVITVSGLGDYDTVKLTSASGKGVSDNKYTVSATDTDSDGNFDDAILISLSSSAKAVTLKVTTDTKYGNIGLSHDDNPPVAEPASAFKVGEKLYLVPQTVPGYVIDSLKVVENISGKEYDLSSASLNANGCYEITDGITNISTGGIPEGGVKITASYKPATVEVAFSGTGTVRAVSSSGDYTVDASQNPTVKFKFGETVTLTPVGDFKWGSVTVDGNPISVYTGGTASGQFKISSTGTVSVVLAP